jgi:undecaprenyl-diphosphatase
MTSELQAILLGLLQGISELFPVSSLGHSVILPKLLGWQIAEGGNAFLVFLVATHLATAIVLGLYYRKDWQKIAAGLGRSLASREIRADDADAKLGWLLVVGTIPAGILGLLLEQQLKTIFGAPVIVAGFLVANGLMLWMAEWLRRKGGTGQIDQLTWGQALAVGASQAVALLPGFSRTGATLAGGLLVGLSHEDAAKYSFLLATPIIGAAAVLKIPDLLVDQSLIGPTFVGAICAGVAAYFSVRFLTRYFQSATLRPFAIYCVLAGILSLGLLAL